MRVGSPWSSYRTFEFHGGWAELIRSVAEAQAADLELPDWLCRFLLTIARRAGEPIAPSCFIYPTFAKACFTPSERFIFTVSLVPPRDGATMSKGEIENRRPVLFHHCEIVQIQMIGLLRQGVIVPKFQVSHDDASCTWQTIVR